MLEILLKDYVDKNTIVLTNDIVYYTFIYIAILFSTLFVYKRLARFNYDKKRITKLISLILVLTFPLLYISSRASNMFYYPDKPWNIDFFIDNTLYGDYHTFHTAMILPIVVISLIVISMRFKFRQIADTVFLYLPFGHAIGRTGCFLVGCCWGNNLIFSISGNSYNFQNPIPLYSIALNFCLFLFLRGKYNKIYSTQDSNLNSGLVVGLYFLIYGIMRFIIEIFRTEKVIAWGLTQAQIVMLFFIVIGSTICLWVRLKKHVKKLDEDIKG